MGYVPPRPPANPTVITEGLWRHPRFRPPEVDYPLIDTIGGGSAPVPTTPYQRYVHDLYGSRPTDFLPALGFVLLLLIVVLPAVVLWAVQ